MSLMSTEVRHPATPSQCTDPQEPRTQQGKRDGFGSDDIGGYELLNTTLHSERPHVRHNRPLTEIDGLVIGVSEAEPIALLVGFPSRMPGGHEVPYGRMEATPLCLIRIRELYGQPRGL